MKRLSRVLSGLLALGALWTATPARAEPGPAHLRPVRDVAVTYRVQGGNEAPRLVPVAWLAASDRIRAEPPGLPGWVLVDLPRNEALLVIEAQGMAVRLPAGNLLPLLGGIPPDTRLSPAGSGTVAGHRCEVWQVRRQDAAGTVCLTEDGVILRAEGARGGKHGRLEATRVTYGRQDPARFQLPAGVPVVNLPPALLSGLLGGR
ncbi:hypothetical protein E0493_01010 [Roseomonas sp. M0104]|uniref:DUF4412 domain-containing protein n=1 Tax=Teichococcus coralli TaxID=2545983 RepID=A0A845B677_9PROT|nr:hypothetical protein [Pseudoroseomonas coralli]MXP61928.1 hypothetical protein [Pseudoroseomonas coralli]